MYTATGREPVFKISSQGLGLQYCLDNADQLYDNQSTSMLGVMFVTAVLFDKA